MDFELRQTPSFTLATPVKHLNAPFTSHIEYADQGEGTCKEQVYSDKPRHHHGHNSHHNHFSVHHTHSHHHGVKQRNNKSMESLPLIPPEKVAGADGDHGSAIWIVIDEIVYDVTEFCKEHPGGDMPLKSFAGKSCSWQFHKVHSGKTLEDYEELAIGRTSGVPNPYKEEKPSIFRQLWKSQFSEQPLL